MKRIKTISLFVRDAEISNCLNVEFILPINSTFICASCNRTQFILDFIIDDEINIKENRKFIITSKDVIILDSWIFCYKTKEFYFFEELQLNNIIQ